MSFGHADMEIFLLTAVLLLCSGRGLSFPARLQPDHHHTELLAARWRRNSDSVAAPLSVSFTVSEPLPAPGVVCYGGDTGLCSTALRLDFRSDATGWLWCEGDRNISAQAGDISITVPAGSVCVEFRLVQEEHGGGNCHCWILGGVVVNGSAIMLQEGPGEGLESL